ncbi:hypothetical protein EJB05_29481 [Eragrostis curvula]|uniref:Seipin n=1 Tax=Eragrostis curvula TaxID=38414 RepID=A0A5J9UV68_9POAL|nr:hypothetical protein EJB05_29481 [Eragrostis curvula]
MSSSCHEQVHRFYRSTALYYRLQLRSEPSPSLLHSLGSYSCELPMDSAPHQVSKYQHDSSLPAVSSGNGLYAARPRSTAAGESTDALLYLAGPAGWLIRLDAFLGERVTSVILSLFFSVAALFGEVRAVPSVIASNTHRAAFGLLAAACTFAVLVSALFVSVLLGFFLVRHWVEEPVTVRQPLYLDYTEHSVRVSLTLLLPDSYHNREVGMFQIKAEAISVTGLTTASATQPYMLRYKSAPVRLAQSALMCVPLKLGMRGETQAANLKVLQYREGYGRHKRTGLIRVCAAAPGKPRRKKKKGKMASDLGRGHLGESPSKELSGGDTMKRRERRSNRKGQFETQSNGGRVELEFAEGSTSGVAMVETSEFERSVQIGN